MFDSYHLTCMNDPSGERLMLVVVCELKSDLRSVNLEATFYELYVTSVV